MVSVRKLVDAEIDQLLSADSIARLATIDAAGYPHVTPVWFLWVDDVFYISNYLDRPHLARVRSNPRVGLVIDTEQRQRGDGERPNRQIRVIGDAVVSADTAGEWTRRIRRKYIDETLSPGAVERGLHRGRALITIAPVQIHAVASV